MPSDTLPYRQIHLDFHTSPLIPDVGADFDADRFAGTLADAGVDSVTCFARCHHGMLYYPSKKHPHLIHPTLKVPDLLNQQIDACHKRGIQVPIYTTVQWDHWFSTNHPEYLCINKEGAQYFHDPLHPGFYFNLDVGHPGYAAFLKEHIDDLFDCVRPEAGIDGIFLDITPPRVNYRPRALEEMKAMGLDPAKDEDVEKHALHVNAEWKKDMFAHIKRHAPDARVFFNQGHVGPDIRPTLDSNTHLELESLPSGGWGYNHFPISQTYARTLGKPTLGMTGKFHTSWGDFGSYKNPPALEFECFRTVAMGAACSVGDQLPPRGELDPQTYRLISPVYNAIKDREAWVKDAAAVTEIAVLTPEAFEAEEGEHVAQFAKQPDTVMGVVLMLTELHEQFDLVDPARDLAAGGYKVLILPDEVPATEEVIAQVRAFVDAGGTLLSTGSAGRLPGTEDAAAFLPVDFKGPGAFSPDYLRPGDLADGPAGSLSDSPHVMYERGHHVEPRAGAGVLAETEEPYFNRTWDAFSSHRHTPPSGKRGMPAAVGDATKIHLAHPVFKQYRLNAPLWCKVIVGNALAKLRNGRPPLLRVDGPSTVTTAVTEKDGRHTVHLLNYIHQRRGDEFDTIEDVIPIHDLTVHVRTDATTATLQPENATLDATAADGVLTVQLPKLGGYAMIELT